jgi:hypothetical protein
LQTKIFPTPLCNNKKTYYLIFNVRKNVHILFGNKYQFFCDDTTIGFYNFQSAHGRSWRSIFEKFDCTLDYPTGKGNAMADMLSRYPMPDVYLKQ